MADPELTRLLGSTSWSGQLAALNYIRKRGYSLPEDTLRLGTSLLCRNSSKLSESKWQVLEDVFFAALRCHSSDWVTATLKALKTQFGSSAKIMRMEAALCEYTGNVQEANAIYESLLATNPHDQLAWKRKCSLLRADGKDELAVTSLNVYLEIFQGDLEAWEELTDILLAQCQFAKAAYAYEEIVLSAPHDFWVLLRYGEIVYSIGGLANLQTARSYFTQALMLHENCLRAMWALHQCCRQIDTLKPEAENTKVKERVTALIQAAYKSSPFLIAAYKF